MKINILTLFMLSLLASCASGTKSVKAGNQIIDDPDFVNIENSDFAPVEKYKFDSKSDFVKAPELATDSRIYSESLMVDSKYEEIDKSELASNDPVTSLSVECTDQETYSEESSDKLYEKHRTDPAYWNQIGLCHLAKMEFKHAILFFNEALNLKKDYVPSLNNLGLINIKKDDDQSALAYFRRAVELAPSSLTPKLNMSLVLLKYGHNEAVVRLLKPYQAELSTSQLSKMIYASALTGARLDQAAIDTYEKIDQDELLKTEFAINFAVSLKRVGSVERAQDIFNDLKGKVSVDPAYEKYLTE
jgi:tetratricopeptide (TPR) repeat protein